MINPADRRAITLENWRVAPAPRWSFQNVCELIPTATICPGSGVAEAPAGAGGLAELPVSYPDGERLTLAGHLDRSGADALIAMRDGAVIAEWRADNLMPERPHTIFSISKSVTGMLAGVAAGEGVLDPDAAVTRYVDLPGASAYATARVRHLLDMTVDVAFDEDYLDRDSVFGRYRRAMLWNPESGSGGTETMAELLAALRPAGVGHGRRFFYASPNTDMLGLVIEGATGRRYADYLADRLWRPMGACGAAYVTVDRAGTARAAGGICATGRDLARFGQLVLDGGRGIIPRAWIEDMRLNGDARAWAEGNFSDMFARGRYRSCWYDAGDDRGSFCAVGIHGQWLWIDPTSRLVLARLSSRPAPSDDVATAREIAVLSAVAREFAPLSVM